MCGRNSLFIGQSDLEARFDAEVVADGGYTPRYNIAPGDDLEVITNEAADNIDQYYWGLIPFWADEPEEGIINARSETADEKRVFETAWKSRPCLVLSSGFTSGKHRTAVPHDRIASIAKTIRRLRWLVSGRSGKATMTRFRV
jgi:putative SOS response-associated peptidase YedK